MQTSRVMRYNVSGVLPNGGLSQPGMPRSDARFLT